MVPQRLIDLLTGVRHRAGPFFTGIGVIVTSDPSALPIASLRPDARFGQGRPALEVLAEMSVPTSEFHDGFHVLSQDLHIERIAQYFGPPVGMPPMLPPARLPGARYMAALLGSRLPGVIATGVATLGQGVAVFQAGREIEG